MSRALSRCVRTKDLELPRSLCCTARASLSRLNRSVSRIGPNRGSGKAHSPLSERTRPYRIITQCYGHRPLRAQQRRGPATFPRGLSVAVRPSKTGTRSESTSESYAKTGGCSASHDAAFRPALKGLPRYISHRRDSQTPRLRLSGCEHPAGQQARSTSHSQTRSF